MGQTMVSGLQWLQPWLVRGANCGSCSGTPNLDIASEKFVVKAFAVKADVVGRGQGRGSEGYDTGGGCSRE